MKKITRNAAAFGAVVIMLLSVSACGDKAGRETMEFENYSYDAVAEEEATDSVEVEEGRQFWHCQGSGVLPARIGKRDISALRDTLLSIAAVNLEGDKAAPKLPRGYKEQLLEPAKQEAESKVINNLSVVLLTPDVMVWQCYHYAYPAGAAHGVYSNTFINYSLADGEIITRQSLFRSGSEQKLTEMVRSQLNGRDDLLVELDEVELPDNFRITPDGVTFVYGIFAIAPYSSGEIEVPLNAYTLGELLTDQAKQNVFRMK